MKVITTSYSEKCLQYFIDTTTNTLKDVLFLKIGYPHQICCSDENWETFSEHEQNVIEAGIAGFCDGWDARGDV